MPTHNTAENRPSCPGQPSRCDADSFDGERPLQVGNGEFAFGMDITGLQTFAPFNTMSHWGWHSSPLPPGKKLEDYRGQTWDTHGRMVQYPMFDPESARAFRVDGG